MIDAGLLVSGDDIAVPHDRFRDRVMVPHRRSTGPNRRLGGRAMAADTVQIPQQPRDTALP